MKLIDGQRIKVHFAAVMGAKLSGWCSAPAAWSPKAPRRSSLAAFLILASESMSLQTSFFVFNPYLPTISILIGVRIMRKLWMRTPYQDAPFHKAWWESYRYATLGKWLRGRKKRGEVQFL